MKKLSRRGFLKGTLVAAGVLIAERLTPDIEAQAEDVEAEVDVVEGIGRGSYRVLDNPGIEVSHLHGRLSADGGHRHELRPCTDCDACAQRESCAFLRADHCHRAFREHISEGEMPSWHGGVLAPNGMIYLSAAREIGEKSV